MTQNINTTSPSGKSEPPPQPVRAGKLAKSTKAQKNLYEPFIMPMFLWRLIRFVVRIIVAIIFDVHVGGRQNVPETGQLILASNHLSYLSLEATHFLLDKDGRTAGKVKGQFVLTRQANTRSPDLRDEVLRGLTLEPTEVRLTGNRLEPQRNN